MLFNFIVRAADNGEISGGVVSCSGLDCNVCELVKTVDNIFRFLTWTSAAVAILFIVIGGFIYIGARGNEFLMTQAKRTIIWAIIGFTLVLLAFLAIKSTYKVIGATNQGFWEEINCDAEAGILSSSSKVAAVPEQSISGLLRGAKNGGIVAGIIKMGGSSSKEFGQLVKDLEGDEMAIFAAADQSDKKPIMAIGKKNNQPELLYVDRNLINQLLRSTSQLLVKNVYAQTGGDDQINELLAEMTQVVERLIEKKQELLLIIAKKANVDSKNPLGNVSVSTIHDITSKVGQCFNSGGYWFMFKDACKAAEQSCGSVKCSVQNDFSYTAGCQCPEGKCLKGSNCIDKK